MPKLCPKCKRTLDESEFHWKLRNIRRAVHCKDCSRKYIREHYWRNREYYLDKVRRRNIILTRECHEYIANHLAKHPCMDCGEKDIVVLEFDHKVKKRKSGEVSRMLKQRFSLARIILEVKKCEVRCANCHRKKTAKESGSWKLSFAPVA